MPPRPRSSPRGPCAAGLALFAALLCAAPSAADTARIHEASLRGGCSLVDVDTIFFDHGRRGWHLVIAGKKHHANMNVGLEHRVSPAGLWTVEVVGCTGGMLGLPIRTPYWVDVPLREMGRVGSVRIVGANGVWRPRLPTDY